MLWHIDTQCIGHIRHGSLGKGNEQVGLVLGHAYKVEQVLRLFRAAELSEVRGAFVYLVLNHWDFVPQMEHGA